MLTNWPIRNKLQLGLGLLLVIVLTLFGSACYGLYAYRSLVKSVQARSKELPLASDLSQGVANLRVTISQARERQEFPQALGNVIPSDEANQSDQSNTAALFLLHDRFGFQYDEFTRALQKYEDQLDKVQHWANRRIGDDQNERRTLLQIHRVLQRIDEFNHGDVRGSRRPDRGKGGRSGRRSG